MEQGIKEDLIIASASKVHEDWCNEELKAFWSRAVDAKKTIDNPGDALRVACKKNGQPRNEVFLDAPMLGSYETLSASVFEDFTSFKSLVEMGAIEVKRFASRDLTDEEIVQAIKSGDYKDGQENILKPFVKLSAASKKENLDAAIGAANVYVQLSEAGVSVEQMETDPKIRELIGVAIHADWLKRNMDHPNDSLKVPYSQLDDWTKGQDLTVFGALLDAVKKDYSKYAVQPVPGVTIPDYVAMEQEVLNAKHI